MEENANKWHFLVASNFVIHTQILIFLVFKIANLSPYRLQITFSMSLRALAVTNRLILELPTFYQRT